MNLSVNNLLSNDVKKPTALVHFERDMSPVEQKVMTLLIFHCQVAKKDEKGFYYIKKSFVRQFLGWDDSNNYPRIYDAFEKIFDNSIKWNFLGKDKTFKSLKCKLIVSLLEPAETGQYIGFKLHPDLEPIIKDPKLFAKIKLIMMSLLAKPKYAFPLYEILSDFCSRGEKTARISFQALRDSLGIKGVYYEDFVAFKKEILKPNLAAINQNTDCKVDYKTYREGRKIAGVEFCIEKQNWQPPVLLDHLKELQVYYRQKTDDSSKGVPVELTLDERAFVESVKPYRITEADALQAIELHSLEGAREIRDYVVAQLERRRATKDKVRDAGAYMMRCLREGYGKRTLEEREKGTRERLVEEITEKQQEAFAKTQSEMTQVQDNFLAHQIKLVNEQLGKMSPEDRADLDRKFLGQNPFWAKRFRESGLEGPLVRSAFYNFAVNELLGKDQRDLVTFAKAEGVSIEAINMLQMAGY